jgi:chemotaxis protein CheC
MTRLMQRVLTVKVGGQPYALPLDSVEMTFDLNGSSKRGIGRGDRVVLYRGQTLPLHDLADLLGAAEAPTARAGVVIWAGGRRRVFGVDDLVGQSTVDVHRLPAALDSRTCSGVLLDGDEIVPLLDPGACAGAYSLEEDDLGFDELQRSALGEIANIGSGHAATALSQLLGKAVDISHADALLTTLAQAADRLGAAAETSAVVDTPVAEGGRILMLFPEGAAAELCTLLGTTIDDELGQSALREIGNILGSSYLNALVQLTGVPLEPEPPQIEIDLLGHVVERRLTGGAQPNDPAILMRSMLTVESSDASFSFLFVPQIGGVDRLLTSLGVGSPTAA